MRQKRWSVRATALVAFCLLSLALRGAVSSYNLPIAGILVEPDGIVSNTGFPSWSGLKQGLRFPDQILEVDGRDITHPPSGEYRAQEFDRAVASAAMAGRSSVHVRVQTAQGMRELDLEIERLGPSAWWTYFGVMFFGSALYVAAVLIAIRVGRGPLARTFTKLAVFASLVLCTFFDYHTTRHLVPLFRLSHPMTPVALICLGLRLPDDVPLVAKRPWVLYGLDGLGLLIASGLLLANSFGQVTGPLEVVCTTLYGVGLLFLAGVVAVRFARAHGERREVLRPLVFTLALPHAVLAGGVMMHGPIKAIADVVAFPMLALTPLATMVAFVRHDIWKSRVLLPRFVTRAVIAAIVCVLAVGFGTAFAAFLGAPFAAALVAAAAAAAAAGALVLVALRLGDKAFFPSLADYKPTVEQLSSELTSLAEPQDVVVAVERTVRRWLPCDTIEFAFNPPAEAGELALSPAAGKNRSDDGLSAADLTVEVDPNELTLPVVFHGVQLGRLRVGQKRNGALFTSEDLDLLKTIANQGALALAHAIAYAELERRRKQQAAAWRDEREALVETLSAEIAHEIRYPINFFRSIFQRASASKLLDEEDLEIGCEEVDRLERLVSGLRRLATQHLDRGVSDVSELCDRAEVLLRDRMGDHPLVIDVGDGAGIRCDVDKVTQILVNLLANALDATEGKGDVGISWRPGPKGGELSVWDTGPGFEGEPSRLFAPWYTTKERGTGLGLAITYRLVRAHGWTIEAMRQSSRTIFVVTVPPGDIVADSDKVKSTESVQSDEEKVRATGSREGAA